MNSQMYETTLRKKAGLRSIHSGVGVWIVQRITAILLIGAMGWVLIALMTGRMDTYDAFQSWSVGPWNKAFLFVLTAVLSVHTALGLKVVVEDYIHKMILKISLIYLIYFGCGGLFLLAFVSIVSF